MIRRVNLTKVKYFCKWKIQLLMFTLKEIIVFLLHSSKHFIGKWFKSSKNAIYWWPQWGRGTLGVNDIKWEHFQQHLADKVLCPLPFVYISQFFFFSLNVIFWHPWVSVQCRKIMAARRGRLGTVHRFLKTSQHFALVLLSTANSPHPSSGQAPRKSYVDIKYLDGKVSPWRSACYYNLHADHPR